jgi:hypothetical protein
LFAFERWRRYRLHAWPHEHAGYSDRRLDGQRSELVVMTRPGRATVEEVPNYSLRVHRKQRALHAWPGKIDVVCMHDTADASNTHT